MYGALLLPLSVLQEVFSITITKTFLIACVGAASVPLDPEDDVDEEEDDVEEEEELPPLLELPDASASGVAAGSPASLPQPGPTARPARERDAARTSRSSFWPRFELMGGSNARESAIGKRTRANLSQP